MPGSSPLSHLFGKMSRHLSSKLNFLKDKKSATHVSSNRDVRTSWNGFVDADAICAIISPFEPHITALQKVLIWEDPPSTLFALFVFNCAYWLIVYLDRTLFSTICIFAFTLKLYQFWDRVIWPEISLPPPPDVDREGWTTVHPQVLSAPEISRHLKVYIEKSITFLVALWRFRRNNHGSFCALITCTLCTTAYLGTRLSGAVIIYFMLMTMALTPGIVLYLLPDQWKDQLRELIHSYTEDQLDGCTAGSKALSGDCSSPEAAMQSTSSSSIPNDIIETRKSLPSSSPSASSSRFESFIRENLGALDLGSLEQVNLFGSSVPATTSGNHSRKSSQSSVQSGGIRFIPSHFNSRASSSSDLNEFELVSESECDHLSDLTH